MCWNGIRAVTFGGVQYVDDLHSVKVHVDHHSSTGTTWDILNLVRLKGGLGRESKTKIGGEGKHSNPFPFHVM